MKFLTTWFSDNPLVVDTNKSVWYRLDPRKWPMGTQIGVALGVLVYGTLVIWATQNAPYLDSSVFAYVGVFATIIVTAIAMYGTIAVEREKRSFELLLVAPLKASQIVAAKLLRAVAPFLGFLILFFIPMVGFGFARGGNATFGLSSGAPFWPFVFGTLLIEVCVAVFVTGMSLLISSMNRLGAGALGGTLGCLFVVYVVVPILAGAVSPISRTLSDGMVSYHPFVAVAKLVYPSSSVTDSNLTLIVSPTTHILLGALLIKLAATRIAKDRAPDGKVTGVADA